MRNEVQPSPSVQRAREMLSDPDRYFEEARRRAEQQVKAERDARKAGRLVQTPRRAAPTSKRPR